MNRFFLVIVGVLAGGEIAGVAGMFLSVPVIAAARIVWRRLQIPEDGCSASPATPTALTAVLKARGPN
jgi:predicted PurR-regulated permease PerM